MTLCACTIYTLHLPQKCTSTVLYIGLFAGTFYGPQPALCTSVHRTPPPSLLVGWGSLLQTPCSITEVEKKFCELVPCLRQTIRDDRPPARLNMMDVH